MSKRPDSVALFMRDLWNFLRSQGGKKGKFCKEIRRGRNLFNNLHKHTPTVETMESLYADMDEAGFVSLRRCQDALILAALAYEPGEEDVLKAAATRLKAYNKKYPEFEEHEA